MSINPQLYQQFLGINILHDIDGVYLRNQKYSKKKDFLIKLTDN